MGCDGMARSSRWDTTAADEVDVITVCQFLALQALEQLTAPGAVSVNPVPGAATLSFLVPADATHWLPYHLGARASCTDVVLPADGKEAPPGPYWLIERSQGLTPVAALRAALRDAVRRWPGRQAQPADSMRELRVPRRGRTEPRRDRAPGGRGW
ncbi:hypothetical protein AQJ46_45580 [Streptomyces canus]|uniref:Uncharacterized protein n=1 Tax=Streptomyces canus TaxID=58343 RepID=A0A101RLM1_9ACTN|nr:hypothetical protein [Streptomyces canus]KUN57799.1 hypothetical protein AQJ46_45580 [Streptomyces canus]